MRTHHALALLAFWCLTVCSEALRIPEKAHTGHIHTADLLAEGAAPAAQEHTVAVVLVVLGLALLLATLLVPQRGTEAAHLPELAAKTGSGGELLLALGSFARVVMWLPKTVIAVLGLCSVVVGINVISLPSHFTANPGAPSWTPAAADALIFSTEFPQLAGGAEFTVAIESRAPAKVLELPGLANFSFALRDELGASSMPLVEFISYPTLLASGLDVGNRLVSKNGTMTLITCAFASDAFSPAFSGLLRSVHGHLERLGSQLLPGASYHLVSFSESIKQTMVKIEKFTAKMDMIVLPIVGLCLAWVLGSIRLLIVPVVTMLSSSLLSFGIVSLVARRASIDPVTPANMMSLLIALCVDYALFLLTKFKSELRSGDTEQQERTEVCVQEAAVRAMQTAGFTVVGSGFMLTLAYVALIFAPVQLISSVGIGCAITIVVIMITNVVLPPALLAAFPHFFFAAASAAAGGTSTTPPKEQEQGEGSPKFWSRVAGVTVSFPRNVFVLAAVALMTAGVGCAVPRIHENASNLSANFRGTPSYKAYKTVSAAFGDTIPMRVLLEAPPNTSVFSSEFWSASQRLLHNLVAELPGGSRETSITFMSYLNGLAVPWARCLQSGEPPTSFCVMVKRLQSQNVNAQQSAAWGYVNVAFDVSGSRGRPWVLKFRELAAQAELSTGIRVRLVGANVVQSDLSSSMWKLMPALAGGTLAIVLVCTGLVFKSVFVVARSCVSICFTLVFVYGLAVRTYQDGLFDWTGVPGLSSDYGLYWISPVLAFTPIISICTDYDIFLMARVTELRGAKHSPDAAIFHGVSSSGGIISAAGFFMVIAFAGHIFSGLEAVNVIGFLLVWATFYDSFIVRPLVTPSLMSLMGRFNWWPSTLSERL